MSCGWARSQMGGSIDRRWCSVGLLSSRLRRVQMGETFPGHPVICHGGDASARWSRRLAGAAPRQSRGPHRRAARVAIAAPSRTKGRTGAPDAGSNWHARVFQREDAAGADSGRARPGLQECRWCREGDRAAYEGRDGFGAGNQSSGTDVQKDQDRGKYSARALKHGCTPRCSKKGGAPGRRPSAWTEVSVSPAWSRRHITTLATPQCRFCIA